jgi:DNA excision repair protein ERCC-2
MKKIQLSIRDFALPVPRIGSIEAHSGYGRSTLEGQEIHLRVQQRRAKAHANYRAEVPLSAEFSHQGYQFKIGGRADGFFDSNPPKIEEIKSTFKISDLSRKLLRRGDEHPYCLQLKTYGYFYWLAHQKKPKLSFHLVSTRNYSDEDLEIELDPPVYELWLNRRLDELVEEAKRWEKRIERRKQLAADFQFPFDNPRPGQRELVRSIEEGMAERRRMLVQAPTGLGKTVGVLYPALKEAMGRGQKVIYVTPKNSQHAVAEDAVHRFRETGTKVKSLTLTAKSKICFKNEPLCNPDYCEFAKDHYTKVYNNRIVEHLSRRKKLTAKIFKEYGEQYQVCPFELQLEAAADVETVICDYNYVFSPRSALGKMEGASMGTEGKPNLVIDEAHNLLSRAMDYYSPSLSTFLLEKMRPAIRELPTQFRAEAEGLLNDCLTCVADCRPEGAIKATKIEPPEDAFLEQDASLRAFLSRYLDSDVDIQPRDVVLRLSFYWSEFTAALEFVTSPKREEFFTTFQPYPAGGGTVKITCCDASEMLHLGYDDYEQVVGFSATLKPFDYYAKLSGLDVEKTKLSEFQSPFPKNHRKLLIIPEISTKWSDRERSYRKIAECIRRISAVKMGNYFAFFPSFDFMARTIEVLITPPGFTVLRQEREMKGADVNGVIEHLKSRVAPTLVFAVQGGVFSEGVDYPGETIIGAFVVGPPLPSFDVEREQMREYYQKHYRAGFDYAYTYPAMAKAVQAAGRVIRSETDRGLIVLMDNRFISSSYSQSMPTDWFESDPKELVSTQILKDVTDFWEGC